MLNPDWTTIKLNDGERLDDLGRCGYSIIQNPSKFCFGVDAVLLSDFAKVRKGERALDLCTGNGIIPILLASRYEGREYCGIEIQEECADLASRSVKGNALTQLINIRQGDIRKIEEYYDIDSFDVVTCNPPYMIDSHGIKNPDSPKAIARHEILCDFEDVARAAAKMLKVSGRLYIIHRPFRLVEIFDTLTKYKLEPKKLRMIHPYVDHEPSMVLIEATLGGKRRITIDKPLIMYESEGEYTQEIYDIYRE